MLVDSGATLGGTVAAGLSGAGRFRFGGLRDFILGVRFVDGTGRVLRMGGKVVKDAAGFDLPKFFVGSLGRFGVLAQITFKVFPRPASTMTLRLSAATLEDACESSPKQAARASVRRPRPGARPAGCWRARRAPALGRQPRHLRTLAGRHRRTIGQ
jgi:FAD/FMN-containing dehydrogenase